MQSTLSSSTFLFSSSVRIHGERSFKPGTISRRVAAIILICLEFVPLYLHRSPLLIDQENFFARAILLLSRPPLSSPDILPCFYSCFECSFSTRLDLFAKLTVPTNRIIVFLLELSDCVPFIIEPSRCSLCMVNKSNFPLLSFFSLFSIFSRVCSILISYPCFSWSFFQKSPFHTYLTSENLLKIMNIFVMERSRFQFIRLNSEQISKKMEKFIFFSETFILQFVMLTFSHESNHDFVGIVHLPFALVYQITSLIHIQWKWEQLQCEHISFLYNFDGVRFYSLSTNVRRKRWSSRVSVRTSIIGWSGGEWQATDDLRKSNRAPKFRRVCSDKTSHGRWTGGTASNVDSFWEVSTVAHSLIRRTLSAAIRQIGLVFNERDDSRGRGAVDRSPTPSATSVAAHLPSISTDLREIEGAARFRDSWKPINCTRAFSSRVFNSASSRRSVEMILGENLGRGPVSFALHASRRGKIRDFNKIHAELIM